MENTANKQTITIIIMRGLPGSGKSQIAHAVLHQLPSKVVVLDPDEINVASDEYVRMSEDLRNSGVDEKLYPYRFLRTQAHQAIDQGKIVLWNQAFTHQDLLDRTIKNLAQHAAEAGYNANTFVVEVDLDQSKAQSRIQDRVKNGGHDVPQDVFDRFVREYTTFASYGYPIIIVSGDDDPVISAQKIVNATGLDTN